MIGHSNEEAFCQTQNSSYETIAKRTNLSQKPADNEVHDCLRRQDHLKIDQWVNVCNVMCF